MKKITVVGSIAMDFVVKTAVVPEQGETIIGESFTTHFGGKGANQAVAASRTGAKVAMIGAVGTDVFGDEVLQNLQANQIETSGIKRVGGLSTGVAQIIIKEGDNRIIVIPGANNGLTEEDIEQHEETLLTSDMVIMQHEVPETIIECVTGYCFDHNVPIILNPAPARPVSQEVIDKVTYLTPNESEFNLMFPNIGLEEALKRYPNKLIVTLGSQGAIFYDGEMIQQVAAFKVMPVDTTGAGDTFNGALAVGVTNGLSLKDSVKFGNLASSVAVQANGAQEGIPYLDELRGQENYEKAWHIEQ